MKNEFVPYEEALALKELGFDEELCYGFYDEMDNNKPKAGISYGTINRAPLYQQAFRWFREEYNIHSIFEHDSDNYYYVIQGVNDFDFTTVDSSEENGLYLKYQKVQDACLRKLIEIVKEKID
jgi:hypothetical protein